MSVKLAREQPCSCQAHGDVTNTEKVEQRHLVNTGYLHGRGGVCRVLSLSWTIHKEPRVWRAGVSRFPGHTTTHTVGRR